MTRQRIWRELKPFVGLVVIVALYIVVRLSFGAMSGSRGVLTPSGGVDSTLAILAFATFVLRLTVLVLVPFVATYRLVMRMLGIETATAERARPRRSP